MHFVFDENEWDGPYDFATALRAWAENDKDVLYVVRVNGIIHEKAMLSGGLPTTHNFSKLEFKKAEWYISKK